MTLSERIEAARARTTETRFGWGNHAQFDAELGMWAAEVRALEAALAVADTWIQAEGENGDAVPDEFCAPAYQEARATIRRALEL